MHKAFLAQFEIAAKDPDELRRFYALLFGWRFSADAAEQRKLSVISAGGNGIGGVISSVGDGNAGGVKLVVEVDDVLENVCYAEELGGRIIELPHEITSAGQRIRVASFADPEGNRVVLSNGSHTLASGSDLQA
jgi:predicted enzyme related to lactoylglutathione lyase